MSWLLDGGTILGFVAVVAILTRGRRRRRSADRTTPRRWRLLAQRVGLLPAPAPLPAHRPIEVVAREARRIGRLYRSTRTGSSFARSEAARRAYDGVLGEGCDALGLAHLLGLLEDGDELDTERVRVERLLHAWGLVLDDAA